MNSEQTLNLNLDSKTLEACLKTVNSWGETTYQNICTGASVTVPWGQMDYVPALLGALLVVFVGGLLLMLLISCWRES